MAIETAKIIQFLREASRVERCHTIPHHGSYSVGQHSFDALSILLVLHPSPSLDLIKALAWHDIHERWLGDIPSTAISSDGEFAKVVHRLERRINRAIGTDCVERLSPEDQCWFRALDKTELYLWAQEQVCMGNMAANSILGNTAYWFGHNSIPTEVKDFLENHQSGRTPDELPR